ncbi:restriction endonuclease subunit S [Acinetobacter baumannii]|uniref:restriction endonuclease subunit S n=1 Tax=Acinetobacter baumannii TaxID=470 RepID=UPI0037DF994F
MSEWQLQTLDSAGIEFIDGDRGKNYPSQDDFLDIGHCLFLSTKNVRANGFDFGDCQFISAEKDELLRKGKLNRGDIVLTTRGTVGNTALYDETVQFEHVRINSGMVIIRMKPTNVDSSFFLYFLRQLDYTSFVSGSAQPQLPIRDLKQIEIALPPLPEQKAIASVLSSLDDKIDLLHRQNKTLEAMAETLFRQWFIEEAKEDWEDKPLSSIATFTNGLACQKYPPQPNEPKLPVLKIKDLTSGISDSSDWATANVDPKYIVNHGDVIFAWSASLMVKIWSGETCVLNQHLFNVTSDEYPKWFFYQWCKYHLEEFISISQSHATTMGHIKRKDLDEAMVKVPSQPELQEMTTSFEPLMDKLITNLKQIQTLEKLRDTLLPKLMSGEVRVQFKEESAA